MSLTTVDLGRGCSFQCSISYENVHPLDGGALRLKFRRDRRPGWPVESPWVFYPRLLGELVVKARAYWSVYRRFKAIMNDVHVEIRYSCRRTL